MNSSIKPGLGSDLKLYLWNHGWAVIHMWSESSLLQICFTCFIWRHRVPHVPMLACLLWLVMGKQGLLLVGEHGWGGLAKCWDTLGIDTFLSKQAVMCYDVLRHPLTYLFACQATWPCSQLCITKLSSFHLPNTRHPPSDPHSMLEPMATFAARLDNSIALLLSLPRSPPTLQEKWHSIWIKML